MFTSDCRFQSWAQSTGTTWSALPRYYPPYICLRFMQKVNIFMQNCPGPTSTRNIKWIAAIFPSVSSTPSLRCSNLGYCLIVFGFVQLLQHNFFERQHQHQPGHNSGKLPTLFSPLGRRCPHGDFRQGQPGYSQVGEVGDISQSHNASRSWVGIYWVSTFFPISCQIYVWNFVPDWQDIA